jgi:hypothetical protein
MLRMVASGVAAGGGRWSAVVAGLWGEKRRRRHLLVVSMEMKGRRLTRQPPAAPRSRCRGDDAKLLLHGLLRGGNC